MDYEVTIQARFRDSALPDEDTWRQIVEDELEGTLIDVEEEEV